MLYSGDLPPPRFNMARYCLEPGPSRPAGKDALLVFECADAAPVERWNYGELADATQRLGGALKAAGLAPGGRILIRMANCSDYALLFFAALGAGFVPVPLSTQLSAAEVDFFLADSGAAAIAVSPGLPVGMIPPSVRRFTADDIAAMRESGPPVPFAATGADDPAYLVYTSGTSARPKGVLHAHRAAWGRRPMYRDWYDMRRDDTMLHAGAFNWTYTLGVGLTDPWANGATAAVYTGPREVSVWPRLIAHSGATLFASVPTLYRQMLKYCDIDRDSFPRLRHGLSAGEALPAAIAQEWLMRSGRRIYEAFGMSELSTYISCAPNVPARPGSPGRPQSGRTIALLSLDDGTTPVPAGQTGVIAAHRSDPGLMLGYWNRPEEEAEMMRGDWFLTGDVARMDGDGYVWLAGRSDDMMNAFGYRVSPLEVEAVLHAHPAVLDAAVAERQTGAHVSIIVAYMVWRDGRPDIDGLIAHARAHLAAYKVPRSLITLTALPRTANGKVRRRALAELAPME